MPNALRRMIAWAALVAWLGASGLSWDLLQVVAWVRMSAENARTMDVASAVTKTMKDAPCSLCCVVKAGRASTESSAPLAKRDQEKAKEKSQACVWMEPALHSPDHDFLALAAFGSHWAPGPLIEVPVPPPKREA